MADPAPTESTLDVALRYAAAGFRVLPIKPRMKRPPMNEWVEAATTNPDVITSWFTERLYGDHGVGLAMGGQPDGRIIFALDIDEHDPAHSGNETLFDLQAEHGRLPDTVRSLTAGGGIHLLFSAPREVRNGVAGDGLDVRGEGGQIAVYPTVHPTLVCKQCLAGVDHPLVDYQWEHGYAPWEHPIAEAPAWLIELVKVQTPTSTPTPTVPTTVTSPLLNDPDSPSEWLRSKWDWPLQLHDAGWAEHSAARNGDVFWTRPGKSVRAGESAVLHLPDGPFVIWSTDASMSALRAAGRLNSDGSVSVSPMQFYAVQRHGGDLSAAARAVRRMMDPDPQVDSRLSVVAQSQTVVERYAGQALDWQKFWSDDHSGEEWVAEPLIPAGRLTVFYAPAKQGKSEITFAVVAALATGNPILGQTNRAGKRDVVYLDYEMTKADLAERLGLLGYTDADDLSHLHYYLLPSLPPLDTAEGAMVMREIAAYHHAEAVVIDTMGRAVEGDENSNDTYRAFARHTGLVLKADGVAVVRTDHAGKDKEKGQRGASAKNDDADVVFRVDRKDSGWKLTRTHTRVGWIPESVVIDREVRAADGTLRIELASSTKPQFPTGTGQFAQELRNAGITVDQDTTVRALAAAAAAVNLPRSGEAIRQVLKLMKSELPRFTDGPTPVEPTRPDKPY